MSGEGFVPELCELVHPKLIERHALISTACYVESFNGKLRDELPNGEIFYTLQEAKVLIEQWRQHYNRFRPHSALDYRPPAPEAIEISPPGFIPLHLRAAQGLTHGVVQ